MVNYTNQSDWLCKKHLNIETRTDVNRISRYVIRIDDCISILIAPWADQARVQSWIVPIMPNVFGKVVKVAVEQEQEKIFIRV